VLGVQPLGLTHGAGRPLGPPDVGGVGGGVLGRHRLKVAGRQLDRFVEVVDLRAPPEQLGDQRLDGVLVDRPNHQNDAASARRHLELQHLRVLGQSAPIFVVGLAAGDHVGDVVGGGGRDVGVQLGLVGRG
jgi:hypothetical protein